MALGFTLVHGLPDVAALADADSSARDAAIEEAVTIATGLDCRPLPARADLLRGPAAGRAEAAT